MRKNLYDYCIENGRQELLARYTAMMNQTGRRAAGLLTGSPE